MNPSKSQATNSPVNWIAVCSATVVWWAVPVLVRLQPRSDEVPDGLVLGCLLGLAFAILFCARLRRAPWVVLLWIPLLVWTGFGGITAFRVFAGGRLGGPSAAPLEGAATIIFLALAVTLSVGVILCLVWHPKTYSLPLIVLAVLNTGAISIVTPQANLQATRQDIVLRILDSGGKPISGASINYERYSYGSGGTDVFDLKGGPLISGENGVVTIPSRRMRYKTRGTITKPGFRDVLFTVEMQFSQWDKDRGVKVSTRETGDIARGRIPTAEPVSLSIYLPPLSDAPDPLHPLKQLTAVTDIGRSNEAARFFNIETGKFNKDAGDLRFDLFFEKDRRDGNYEVARLRVTGLNGTQVLQSPPDVSLSESLSPYAQVFRIAPESGYHDEIILQDSGSLSGPTVYLKVHGGQIYGRMNVEAWGKSDRMKASCKVWLFLNPTGQRQLER